MSFLIEIVLFLKVFMLFMSIFYTINVLYEIVKVYSLREGKVEFGKHGLLYLGASLAYIMTCIFA